MNPDNIGGEPSSSSNSIPDSKENKYHVNPSSGQSPASGRLVYVRRRVELDTSKDIATNKPREPTLSLVSSSTVAPPSPVVSGAWEERYHHLQILLNKLNDSHHTDHVQMLWSLSSAELSKHAVELEKRSIQFSLEEAREMQRVAALNVLGKSTSKDEE